MIFSTHQAKVRVLLMKVCQGSRKWVVDNLLHLHRVNHRSSNHVGPECVPKEYVDPDYQAAHDDTSGHPLDPPNPEPPPPGVTSSQFDDATRKWEQVLGSWGFSIYRPGSERCCGPL